MNHTPGPWHAKAIDTINGRPAYWHIVDVGAGGVIGDVQSVNPADARLIAAAPALYAALDELLRVTVDADLAAGFVLTEAEHDARERALAVFERINP